MSEWVGGSPTVAALAPDGQAAASGVKAGWRVVSVAGVPVATRRRRGAAARDAAAGIDGMPPAATCAVEFDVAEVFVLTSLTSGSMALPNADPTTADEAGEQMDRAAALRRGRLAPLAAARGGVPRHQPRPLWPRRPRACAAIAAVADAPPAETAGASGGGAVFVVGGGDYSGAPTAHTCRAKTPWRALAGACRRSAARPDLLVVEGARRVRRPRRGARASTRALLLVGGRAQFDAAGNYNKWQIRGTRAAPRRARSPSFRSRAARARLSRSHGDPLGSGSRTAQPSIEICDADGLLSGTSGWTGLTTIPVAPALDGWHACFAPV